MGWCGAYRDTSSWQHGTIDPCSSETVSATILALCALGVVWAAARRVRLLRGYRPGQQKSQLAALIALGVLTASHAAWFFLTCIRGPVPYQIFYEAAAALIWTVAVVSLETLQVSLTAVPMQWPHAVCQSSQSSYALLSKLQCVISSDCI